MAKIWISIERETTDSKEAALLADQVKQAINTISEGFSISYRFIEEITQEIIDTAKSEANKE